MDNFSGVQILVLFTRLSETFKLNFTQTFPYTLYHKIPRCKYSMLLKLNALPDRPKFNALKGLILQKNVSVILIIHVSYDITMLFTVVKSLRMIDISLTNL